MWTKRVLLDKTRLIYCENLRLMRPRSLSSASYLHNVGNEPLTYATVGEVLADVADRHPGRLAVRSLHENLSLTYEQLLTQADALGCALRARGLEKGDRVGIWSHNSASWIVAMAAAARVGLISVAINPVYEKPELSYCIKKAGLRSLLIGDKLENRDYYGLLTQLIPELKNAKQGTFKSNEFPTLGSVVTCGKEKLDGTITFDSLISERRSEGSQYVSGVTPEDGCIIHFTSGTTGNPKAALDSHFSIVNNTYYIGKRLSLQEDHQTVCVQVPIFHALGSLITVMSALRHGSSLVLAAPTYNVTSNVKTLFTENCSVITGTPTMYVDLISQVRTKDALPKGVRVALAGGAPCSPQLIRDMQNYLKADSVNSLYGLTETTASVFQSLPGDSTEQVAETVGYLQDHVEVKVVDDKGKIVPFGVPGELLARGYNSMICYWDDPENTRKTLGEDGWLRTGDKFTISPDGYGRIVGRIKDIIVRGGENIAPKEIEDLLNTHPDIVESQVVGVSDERLGEELCAVLRMREGACVDVQELRRHCSGRLAKFKVPRILKTVEEFPKTASGKIQKHKLRDMIESGEL